MAILPGWQPLIVCTGAPDPASTLPECHLGELLQLVKNGMTDLMLIASLIVVFAAIIAGFKLVTAGMSGNYGAANEAKRMFGKIVTGFAVVLLAWLIVYTLASTLLKGGPNGFYYFLGT
jgi:hypothetical protein